MLTDNEPSVLLLILNMLIIWSTVVLKNKYLYVCIRAFSFVHLAKWSSHCQIKNWTVPSQPQHNSERNEQCGRMCFNQFLLKCNSYIWIKSSVSDFIYLEIKISLVVLNNSVSLSFFFFFNIHCFNVHLFCQDISLNSESCLYTKLIFQKL